MREPSRPDPARLTSVAHVVINFRNGTRQWVDVRRFAGPAAAADDTSMLAGLIGHELYGDDYAGGGPGEDPQRHGPYRRDRITPAGYDPIDPGAAERQVRLWAGQFAPVPGSVRPELRREVYAPLRTADRVYRLRDLGRAAFHDWGGVHHQFHEFVLVHRTRGTLTLIVAADD